MKITGKGKGVVVGSSDMVVPLCVTDNKQVLDHLPKNEGERLMGSRAQLKSTRERFNWSGR